MQQLDAVPSVTKQGRSVHLLKSPVGGYNAGLLKVDGGDDGVRLCARIVTFPEIDGHKRMRFVLAWFRPTVIPFGYDDKFNIEPLGTIEIVGFDPDGHAEDPRIFKGPDGSTYVSFCHATDDIKKPACQRVAKFEDGNLFRAHLMPVTEFAGNGHPTEPRPQKNWNFFFQGARLFCIYWTYPHRVLELDPITWQVINEFSGEDDKAFKWQYGPLSGGTPPIEWRGQYLAFYHGWMPHPVRRRRYYMGAYTFEMQPPFRITSITAPLLRGSLNDPTNFEPPNHAGLPLVVFPCGLMMEDGDPDQCLVSMGINDSYMATASFDLRLMPFIDVAEMKDVKTFYFFTQDTAIPPRASLGSNLSWARAKQNAGGLLATQNPMAIDDCLTRGNVGEITKEMYDALLESSEEFPGGTGDVPKAAQKMMSVFEDVVEKACRLPGWSTPEKNMDFASIVLALHPDVVVEIGVYGGRSMASIAFALKAIGRGMVYGIDPWSPEESTKGEVAANIAWWGRLDHESIYRTCAAAVDRFGLGDFVNIQRKRSDEAAIPNDIGFLIIDGNHSGDAPGKDVDLYVPKVRPGGIIYMDDMGWTGGMVRKAAQRLESEFGCVLLYARDEGAFFQKLK